MDNKVNIENYYVVQGWMVKDLGLKGNELAIYAIIYGFSQTEGQAFNGGLQYLADWTNSTKQGIIKCLNSLESKGLIIKNEHYINGIKFCEYRSTKFNTVKQSLIPPVKQSLTNNKEYNINNIKENEKEKLETSSNTRAHKYGEYKHILLTDKQMAKLIEDYGEEATNKAITYLDEYIQMKGYKCKDHNLAIRKWVFDALKEHGAKKQQVTSSYQGRNYSESDLNSMFMGLGDLKI